MSTSSGSAPEARVRFVVLRPDGGLVERVVDNKISYDDEWGPYQDTLWDAVRSEVDPHRGQVDGVPLIEGMRTKITEDASKYPELYPVNEVASAMLVSLGAAPVLRRGTIVVVGHEDEETGLTGSLTAGQRALLDRAHRLAHGS